MLLYGPQQLKSLVLLHTVRRTTMRKKSLPPNPIFPMCQQFYFDSHCYNNLTQRPEYPCIPIFNDFLVHISHSVDSLQKLQHPLEANKKTALFSQCLPFHFKSTLLWKLETFLRQTLKSNACSLETVSFNPFLSRTLEISTSFQTLLYSKVNFVFQNHASLIQSMS